MTHDPTTLPALRLENRHTGEVLELRRIRRDGRTHLDLRGTLPPRREGPPLHVHHAEDEEGEIIAGTLSAELAGQQMEVRSGPTVRFPRGIPHRWWNAGDETLVFVGRADPIVDLDRYLQAVFEVLNAGEPGRPPLFYLAHLALRHRDTQTVMVIPAAVQAVLFRVALAVGTMLGRYRGSAWPGCPARCTGAPEYSLDV
jgi:mannose-6-phosphate isomerase-like protein (cupin superfamily)